MLVKPITLDHWEIVTSGTCGCCLRLSGYAPDHPTTPTFPPGQEKHDGCVTLTSIVLNASGRLVDCESRVYRLGAINPVFRKWLERNVKGWKKDEPLKSFVKKYEPQKYWLKA